MKKTKLKKRFFLKGEEPTPEMVEMKGPPQDEEELENPWEAEEQRWEENPGDEEPGEAP